MGGSAGAPIRYEFTGRGRNTISPWTNGTYTYSILQLNLGSNPISKLEVVSTLNTLSQANDMYYYNYGTCPAKYAPKLYLGTLQTTSKEWNMDKQNIENYPSIWPQSYQQGSQKGELQYR